VRRGWGEVSSTRVNRPNDFQRDRQGQTDPVDGRVYSVKYMVANTSATSSVRDHCGHVVRRNGGRATGSRTAAATVWRTATTPTGPNASKA